MKVSSDTSIEIATSRQKRNFIRTRADIVRVLRRALTLSKLFSIFSALLLLSSAAQAYEDHGKSGFVQPYLSYDHGSFKFEDDGDSGTFQGMGLGARIGYHYYFAFFALEGQIVFPRYSHHKDLIGAQREAYYLPNYSMTNTGGSIGFNLSRFTFTLALFIDSKIEGKIANNLPLAKEGNFTYHGTGARIGMDIRVLEGLTIGLSSSSYSYGRYSVDRDVNSLVKADNAAHNKLTISATTVALSYRFNIDEKTGKK